MGLPQELLAAGESLRHALRQLQFAEPVSHVYNPLEYAWEPYVIYLQKYASAPKRVLFLGMNPGPFGMVQTGIPFGEVESVRSWLQIRTAITPPANVHPKRPVLGFDCARSEVSGRRLWGLFAEEFGSAIEFAAEHLVMNYCPLAFMEATGRNRTPDKLPVEEREALYHACDEHLARVAAALTPEWVIGVGDFAAKRAAEALAASPVRVGRILHPSPANPAANRDWRGAAKSELEQLGVWRRVKPGGAKATPPRPDPKA